MALWRRDQDGRPGPAFRPPNTKPPTTPKPSPHRRPDPRVKKQTELDLAAMEQFYKIYGEFFAVWKLWDDAIQQNSGKRNELFERIAGAEAQLEALILRISCQRSLTEDEAYLPAMLSSSLAIHGWP